MQLMRFVIFFSWVAEYGIRVHVLRSDRGGEFTSNALRDLLQAQNVQHYLSGTGDSETMGSVERQFRTLWESVRTILLDQGLPRTYWGLAAHYAIYVDNRALAPGQDITRYQCLLGRQPHADRVHIFGAPLIWVPSVKIQTGKLTPRGRRGTFLGVDGSQVVVLDTITKRLVYTRHVDFIDVPVSASLVTSSAPEVARRLQLVGGEITEVDVQQAAVTVTVPQKRVRFNNVPQVSASEQRRSPRLNKKEHSVNASLSEVAVEQG
jgi:hypothetical protein